MAKESHLPLAVSPAVAAELLGLSETTVRTMIRTGALFSRRQGTRWVIPRAAVEAYLEGREWPPSDAQVARR